MSFFIFAPSASANAMAEFQEEVIPTSGGDLKIYFFGHVSLMLEYNGKIIHVDPFSQMADYNLLPKADAILITHQHRDHCDLDAIKPILKDNTDIVLNAKAFEIVGLGQALKNGETAKIIGIPVEATPAYNLVHKRDNGAPFHPKGEGNGYILTFGDKRIYIAGDTENFPEMRAIRNIDVAFLPINLPFTMTAQMAKDAALMIQPKVIYPYHFHMSTTDVGKFPELMKDVKNIEVRMRNVK
jgi:L-ascorbate metabolism protein UlaG (beta-lactamase superfamily)